MTKRPSIDGFIPRRSPGTIGSDVNGKLPTAQLTGFNRPQTARRYPSGIKGSNMATRPTEAETNALTPTQVHGLTRIDIDESLREIDNTPPKVRAKTKKHRHLARLPNRKTIKWVSIVLVVLLIVGGAFLGIKTIISSNSVFHGDIFGLVQQKKLQQDEAGRTNVLVLGTSEDDPGHPGAHLTDSIMLLSVDQTKKNAYMISIPRDLEVKYGMACNAGYAGKINEFFNCVNQDWTSDQAEEERQLETRKFIGGILGIDIQYSAHVNYSVMRDIVSALGTVTVDIQGSGDAPGVMDSNFDWKCKDGNPYASQATMKRICPPSGHFIDYPNGPAELDAEHALYLAQARGDSSPTYGLGNSNFDREQNQQKIIVAMKEKAMSTGTLTNIGKVTGLIDAIGKNLRTNFETSEIRTLISLAQDIPSEQIQRINLLDDEIMTANAQPAAGKYNFADLQAFVKKKLYATGIAREDPHVIVLNGSGIVGAAQTEADKLIALGMTVDAVDNAPSGKYTANKIYRVGPSAKSKTADELAKLYGVSPQAVKDVPGVTIGEKTDYVVVLVVPSKTATEQ